MTSEVADADNVHPGRVGHSKPDHIPDVDQRSNVDSNNAYPDYVIPSSQHAHGTLIAGDTMYDLTEFSGILG
ncbi:hypothetical protein GOBAR_DD16892 [Gossypium barbadense]|nr:hypothetical protein GOBAR_DD16892 [Gossypium barbadense]